MPGMRTSSRITAASLCRSIAGLVSGGCSHQIAIRAMKNGLESEQIAHIVIDHQNVDCGGSVCITLPLKELLFFLSGDKPGNQIRIVLLVKTAFFVQEHIVILVCIVSSESRRQPQNPNRLRLS